MAAENGTFKTLDGIDLHECWRHPERPPLAGVVLVHDWAENSGRYLGFAEQLAQHGYAVETFDLRGHGESAGNLNKLESFDLFLEDLGIFLDRVSLRVPEKPLFLMGQGLGGGIVLLYKITRNISLRGTILVSPMIKIGKGITGYRKKIAPFIGKLFPKFPLIRFDRVLPPPASDEESQESSNPKKSPTPITAFLGAKILHAAHRIQTHVHLIHGPILILHGEANPLMAVEGSKLLFSKIKEGDKNLRIYSESIHYLLFEAERDKVRKDILNWMDSHIRKSDR